MSKKKDYERPECAVHEVETENFICTSISAVAPNAPQTTEEDWEDGGIVDGGVLNL